MHLSLIIPCYNEAAGVAQLHTHLALVWPALEQRGSCELILVDDGSSDGTHSLLAAAFADWPNLTLVRHAENCGLGAALRTGFAASQGDIVVTTDSDGTYPLQTIPALLDLLQPDVDIVSASPYHPAGGVDGVPAYRLVFSKGASLLYRLLVDARLHTYTAMYRAYRREVIEQVTTTSTGFLMVTELMVGALLAGYRVAELPAVLRVRRYGQSKARVWQITRAHLQFQRRIIGQRLLQARRAAGARGA